MVAAPLLADVSTPTPLLPIQPATWDAMAFARRCEAVRVGSHGLKAFYLSLALKAQPLKRADCGVFRIRLSNLLHSLEIGERAFYRNRKALERQGLVSIRRTAKSTEVRLFAKRMIAEAPPWSDSVEVTESARSPSLIDSVEVTESDSVEVTESIDREYRQDVRTPAGVKASTARSSVPRVNDPGDDRDDGFFIDWESDE